MDAEFEVSSETENRPYYLYNYEMLEAFRLFIGKKLLSYCIENCTGMLTLDAHKHIIFFQLEDFRFEVHRCYSLFRCFQRIYIRPLKPKTESNDGIPINETVEDVILELESLSDTSKKEVFNIIFKLKDKYFVPSLDVNRYTETERRKKIYYSTLDEYLNETIKEKHRIQKLLKLVLKLLELVQKFLESEACRELRNNIMENCFRKINYDHSELISLNSFLDNRTNQQD